MMAYPIVLGGNHPPLLNEDDLIQYVRERCGYEVAEAVRVRLVGMESYDLDDIDAAAGSLNGVLRDFEDALDELKDSIKAVRSRLNV